MLDESYYEKINTLKNYNHFKECINLSEDKYKVEYHMELIIRYLIAKRNKVVYGDYNPATEKLADFLDHETSLLIADRKFKIDEEIELFKKTFDLLAEKLGKYTFRKYNDEKECFEGAFSNASYEAILVGVAENIEKLQKKDLKKIIQKMYSEEKFLTYSARGVRVINRFKGLNEFSREYFTNAN